MVGAIFVACAAWTIFCAWYADGPRSGISGGFMASPFVFCGRAGAVEFPFIAASAETLDFLDEPAEEEA